MTLTKRLTELCQLIKKECSAAREAIPCDTSPQGDLYVALGSLREAAALVAIRAAGALELDLVEDSRDRENRARLLATLATPEAMAAYGAPPVASTIDALRPEPVPFDREAFRREAALRMLETEKGRYGAAEDAARSVALADALIAALEGPPRGT